MSSPRAIWLDKYSRMVYNTACCILRYPLWKLQHTYISLWQRNLGGLLLKLTHSHEITPDGVSYHRHVSFDAQLRNHLTLFKGPTLSVFVCLAQSRIATETGYDRSTIQRAIAALEATTINGMKMLSVDKIADPMGTQIAVQYSLFPQAKPDQTAEGSAEQAPVATTIASKRKAEFSKEDITTVLEMYAVGYKLATGVDYAFVWSRDARAAKTMLRMAGKDTGVIKAKVDMAVQRDMLATGNWDAYPATVPAFVSAWTRLVPRYLMPDLPAGSSPAITTEEKPKVNMPTADNLLSEEPGE
jgi:hypothetical protein